MNNTNPKQDAQADVIPGPSKPFPGPIDWSKPVRTKGGQWSVRILAIDWSLEKPIIGVIEGCGGSLASRVSDWHGNGQFHPGSHSDCLDLENVPASVGERLAELLTQETAKAAVLAMAGGEASASEAKPSNPSSPSNRGEG